MERRRDINFNGHGVSEGEEELQEEPDHVTELNPKGFPCGWGNEEVNGNQV